MAGRVFGAGGNVVASTPASNGGRVNWATAGINPTTLSASESAPRSLSPQDQHLVDSFTSLDTPTRTKLLTKLLTNFQAQAKVGNSMAAHKLSLLTPAYKAPQANVPGFNTPNPSFQDNTPAGKIYQAEQAVPGVAKNIGKQVVNSYATTGKTILTLPHALNAAGIATASVLAGQHGAALAKSKQAALNEIQKTPVGKYFGKTVAQNNAMPAGRQAAGIAGQSLENVLNAATLGEGAPLKQAAEDVAKPVASKLSINLAAKQAASGSAGYIRNLASGQFSRTAVHPDDAAVMASFIDHARGVTKLTPAQSQQLELDASRIAEHYNIGGKAATNAKLANSFDKVLSASPEALRGGNLAESGKLGLPQGKALLSESKPVIQGAKLGAGYGVAQAGQNYTTNPLDLAKTIGGSTLIGGAIGGGASLISKAAKTDLTAALAKATAVKAGKSDVADTIAQTPKALDIPQTPDKSDIVPKEIMQDVHETIGEPDKSDKQVASTLRQAYSGAKNEQVVRGNQLADLITKMAPGEQHALMWYREAGGDVNKLAQWAADPAKEIDPYRADIQQAMDLSPHAKAASDLLDQHYEKLGKQSLDVGSIHNIRQDYNNARLYKQEPSNSIKPELGSSLRTATGHAKARVYDTVFDAVKNGKIPATTDASKLMSIHNEELARVNSARTLYEAMKQGGIGEWFQGEKEVPQGWTVVDRRFDQNFAAPDNIAKGMKPLVDPGFLSKIDAYRALGKYQGLVKTVDLSFSLFHHITETAQAMYQVGIHPAQVVKTIGKLGSENSPEFSKLEQDFVRHTGITSKVHQNLDMLSELHDSSGLSEKLANLPGFKQVRVAVEKNNEFLFDHLQRYIKVMDYGQKVATWAGRHPNATDSEVIAAKRGFAREVNSAYGGLNWEAMGVSKTAQQMMRAVLLAPDWLVSNLSLGKMAATEGIKSTAGNAARANLATAALGSLALTEMANKAITGHWTNENPKAHELEVQVAPHVYISLFRGPIGELVKLGSNVVDNGPISGVARYLQSKGSPVARTALGLVGNTNYYGQAITSSKNGFVKNTGSSLSFALQNLSPVPFGAVGAAKYAGSHEVTPAGLVATASGIGRYSAPGGAQQRYEAETKPVQKLLTEAGYAAAQPKQQQRNVKLSNDQYTKFKTVANSNFNSEVEKAINDGYFSGMSAPDAKKALQHIEASATHNALNSVLGKTPKPTSSQKSKTKALSKYTKAGN